MNGMYTWLGLIKTNYAELLEGVQINRAGYVRRQFYAWFMQLRLGTISRVDFLRNLKLLSFADWVGLAATVFDRASWTRLLRGVFSRGRKTEAEAQWSALRPLRGVANIRQFGEWLEGRNGVSK